LIKKTPVDLRLPLSSSRASELRLGQTVTVSGTVFTGRSRFHIRAVEENILPPVDFSRANCFFHVGPVMKKTDAGWEVVSIEPTSSIRFERYAGDVIRKLELRAVMGKTTLGERSGKALRDVGGVYLSKIGVCGNMLGKQVKKVRGVYFLDELGKTEATWVFEVEKFGPFFVAIDARGDNYFEELRRDSEKNAARVKKALGIPDGFTLTEV
jgi:fumarate hydratase subunit beta